RGTAELPPDPTGRSAGLETPAARVQAAREKGVENLSFDDDGNAEVRGRVVGAQNDFYAVVGEAGDNLSVTLEPGNRALYFEVLRTRNDSSMFQAGDSGVHHWKGGLPADETYLIRVYLYPSAVRYNERSDYTLRINLQPPTLGGKPRR
ncbi:MAG: hypothetical protein U9Q71_08485, partial [Pseudomonadota bacterium]|nr:hypothetical protein [Pseudomonadota bacterium]